MSIQCYRFPVRHYRIFKNRYCATVVVTSVDTDTDTDYPRSRLFPFPNLSHTVWIDLGTLRGVRIFDVDVELELPNNSLVLIAQKASGSASALAAQVNQLLAIRQGDVVTLARGDPTVDTDLIRRTAQEWLDQHPPQIGLHLVKKSGLPDIPLIPKELAKSAPSVISAPMLAVLEATRLDDSPELRTLLHLALHSDLPRIPEGEVMDRITEYAILEPGDDPKATARSRVWLQALTRLAATLY